MLFRSFVHRETSTNSGVTTDARRCWNQQRGLPVRVNLNPTDRDGIERALRERLNQDEVLFALACRSVAGLDAAKWTQWLYDDACENAPDILGVAHVRLAQRLGLGTDPSDSPDSEAFRLIDAVVTIITDLFDQRMYDTYFQIGRAHV